MNVFARSPIICDVFETGMGMNTTVMKPGGPDSSVFGPQFAFHQQDGEARGALAARFASAKPYPHIVVDDFVTAPLDAVVADFPTPDWTGWAGFNDAYQHQKRYCGEIERLPPRFQAMVHELNGPAFLGYLERVTGIKGLLPDPYLTGGGLHSSGPGGILAPHADFHKLDRVALFRRLNILVYFNPGWEMRHGGDLEFYEKGKSTPEFSVVPMFGRMVVFETDDRSIHGFSRPITDAPGWRNSLALYYYTSEDTGRFTGDGVTYWQSHGVQRPADAVRLMAYKGLLKAAWVLSTLAHRVNPNLRRGTRPVG